MDADLAELFGVQLDARLCESLAGGEIDRGVDGLDRLVRVRLHSSRPARSARGPRGRLICGAACSPSPLAVAAEPSRRAFRGRPPVCRRRGRDRGASAADARLWRRWRSSAVPRGGSCCAGRLRGRRRRLSFGVDRWVLRPLDRGRWWLRWRWLDARWRDAVCCWGQRCAASVGLRDGRRAARGAVRRRRLGLIGGCGARCGAGRASAVRSRRAWWGWACARLPWLAAAAVLAAVAGAGFARAGVAGCAAVREALRWACSGGRSAAVAAAVAASLDVGSARRARRAATGERARCRRRWQRTLRAAVVRACGLRDAAARGYLSAAGSALRRRERLPAAGQLGQGLPRSSRAEDARRRRFAVVGCVA